MEKDNQKLRGLEPSPLISWNANFCGPSIGLIYIGAYCGRRQQLLSMHSDPCQYPVIYQTREAAPGNRSSTAFNTFVPTPD